MCGRRVEILGHTGQDLLDFSRLIMELVLGDEGIVQDVERLVQVGDVAKPDIDV